MTTERYVEDVETAAEKNTWSEDDFTLEPPPEDTETTTKTQLSARVATNTGR